MSSTVTIYSPRAEDIHGQPIGRLAITMSTQGAAKLRTFLRNLPAPDRAQQNLRDALDDALKEHDRAVAIHALETLTPAEEGK